MKRIDILLLLELFNIKKRKSYSEKIIKDSINAVRHLCCRKHSNGLFGEVINTYDLFKKELRSIYIKKSPKEYKYCQELLDYMDCFETFVEDLF